MRDARQGNPKITRYESYSRSACAAYNIAIQEVTPKAVAIALRIARSV